MWKSVLWIGIILVSVALCVQDKPYLIVNKSFPLSKTFLLIAEKNVTVHLSVYNMGTRTAYDIELDDTKWPEVWEKQVGLQKIQWDKLAPGANFTHSYITLPREAGVYDVTAATVSYRDAPKGGNFFQGRSTSFPRLKVWHITETDRRTKPHLKEWMTFLAFSAGSVFLPGVLFLYIYLNFENGIAKK